MKVTDNCFSERIPTQSNRTTQVSDNGRNSSGTTHSSSTGTGSDSLQLSSIASRLQNTSSVDSGRSSRLSAIAQAVQSKSFQVDSMQISKALVSEAVSTGR